MTNMNLNEELIEDLIFDEEDPSEFWGLTEDYHTEDIFLTSVKEVSCLSLDVMRPFLNQRWAIKCFDDDECGIDGIGQPHYHLDSEPGADKEAAWHVDLISIIPFSCA